MQESSSPSLLELVGLKPLLWAVCVVIVLFVLYLFPLLTCAVLGRGRLAAKANRQLDRFFDLFHAVVDCFRKRRDGQQ